MHQITRVPVVGLAGGWIGTGREIALAFATFSAAGVHTVLHAGDFGIGSTSRARQHVEWLHKAASRYEMTVYVTPGDRDDPRTIAAVDVDPATGLRWLTERIAVFPPGWRGLIGDKTFVSLGGAIPQTPYPAEGAHPNVTVADALAVIASGRADVMMTHEAPFGGCRAVERWLALQDDVDAAVTDSQRALVTEAWREAQPDVLVHGHYPISAHEMLNVEGFTSPTQVVSLNQADEFGNLALLDLRGPVPRPRFVDASMPETSAPLAWLNG